MDHLDTWDMKCSTSFVTFSLNLKKHNSKQPLLLSTSFISTEKEQVVHQPPPNTSQPHIYMKQQNFNHGVSQAVPTFRLQVFNRRVNKSKQTQTAHSIWDQSSYAMLFLFKLIFMTCIALRSAYGLCRLRITSIFFRIQNYAYKDSKLRQTPELV